MKVKESADALERHPHSWCAAENQRGFLLNTQIRFAYHLICFKLCGGVGEDDLAGLDDVTAVGDRKRHQGVLLNQQNGGAFLVDLLDGV